MNFYLEKKHSEVIHYQKVGREFLWHRKKLQIQNTGIAILFFIAPCRIYFRGCSNKAMIILTQNSMSLLTPKKLHKGDTIGIVSPSAPITPELLPLLKKGREFLHDLGFRTEVGKNCMKEMNGSAGTPEERAEDINSMFGDKKITGIICSQGGDTANSTLPHLDFKLIKENPKVFQGISDITVLLNAIHARTGLVTFHGNDVMFGFGRNPTSYDRNEFTGRLMEGSTGQVNKNSEWKSVRPGIAEGRLMGGNLSCLLKLVGTPYQPDFSDSILFLEALDDTSGEFEYMLEQMKQMGVFDRIKGVLVGYVWGMQKSTKARKQEQMEEVLMRVTSNYDFPIVKCNDFGHNIPNTTLPVGSKALLSGTETGPTMEMIEKCVA